MHRRRPAASASTTFLLITLCLASLGGGASAASAQETYRWVDAGMHSLFPTNRGGVYRGNTGLALEPGTLEIGEKMIVDGRLYGALTALDGFLAFAQDGPPPLGSTLNGRRYYHPVFFDARNLYLLNPSGTMRPVLGIGMTWLRVPIERSGGRIHRHVLPLQGAAGVLVQIDRFLLLPTAHVGYNPFGGARLAYGARIDARLPLTGLIGLYVRGNLDFITRETTGDASSVLFWPSLSLGVAINLNAFR